jgi:hypothetical protein
MKAVHKHAFAFAANHFVVSLVLGVICLMQFYGAGLSDAYHPTPLWLLILVALLWVLQLPVAIFETVMLRHSQHGANVLLLCVLGFLWSLCLGYLVPWMRQTFRSRKDRP